MKESQWTINIEDTSEWVSQVNNDLASLKETCSKQSERWAKQSIYKVPSSVKELCKEDYRPHTVSIGPYHHGQGQLKEMEEHKQRALRHFLNRSGKPLNRYVEPLFHLVEQLKDAYDKLDDNWQQNTEAFLQLMVVDGCFILELLRTTTAEPKENSSDQTGYGNNDPVFSSHGRLYIVPYLKRDMLLLENQLPMQVLTTLLAVSKGTPTQDNVSEQKEVSQLVLKFFDQPSNTGTINCLHILDVYRKSLISDDPNRQKNRTTSKTPSWKDKLKGKGKDKGLDTNIIRSAIELNEAGISIVRSQTSSLIDISFHGGVLKLPPIVVDDTLGSQLLNLVAFERLHVGAGSEVTSYVFFMDSIIDSARDVSVLHWCGIIKNALGSDKAVANLFNSLSKDITLDPNSSLDVVHEVVSAYCQKPWPRWKAYAKHNYFSNPWAIVSVVAAAVLFALTGLQTAYSVLGYYKPGGN